jgi:hypothetical protein
MEQSPSWEANQFSASQIPPHFMEPEGSLPHSQVPATCPYPIIRRKIGHFTWRCEFVVLLLAILNLHKCILLEWCGYRLLGLLKRYKHYTTVPQCYIIRTCLSYSLVDQLHLFYRRVQSADLLNRLSHMKIFIDTWHNFCLELLTVPLQIFVFLSCKECRFFT